TGPESVEFFRLSRARAHNGVKRRLRPSRQRLGLVPSWQPALHRGRNRSAVVEAPPHIAVLTPRPVVQQTTPTSSPVSARKMPEPESPDETDRRNCNWPSAFGAAVTTPSSRLPGLSTP